MKTIARYVWAIAALGGVLFVSSCNSASTTTRTARIRQVAPVNKFTVVESSTGRELSPQETTQLRDAVAKFLEGQGVGRAGEYYVRVDFTPEKPGEPGEWVVVKVTNLPGSTYTLIAAYPAIGPDDYYPYEYAYDQRYGYGGSSYGYYQPPIFYPTNYHPRPHPVTPRQRDDDKPGDRDNRPRGTNDGGRHDRNDGPPAQVNRPRNADRVPRSSDSGAGPQERARRDSTPRSPDFGRSRERGSQDSTPRSSDFGRSSDHGSRDSTPAPSSERSSGSSYSPPPPAPVSEPVSQPSRDTDSNSSNPRNREQPN